MVLSHAYKDEQVYIPNTYYIPIEKRDYSMRIYDIRLRPTYTYIYTYIYTQIYVCIVVGTRKYFAIILYIKCNEG